MMYYLYFSPRPNSVTGLSLFYPNWSFLYWGVIHYSHNFHSLLDYIMLSKRSPYHKIDPEMGAD